MLRNLTLDALEHRRGEERWNHVRSDSGESRQTSLKYSAPSESSTSF